MKIIDVDITVRNLAKAVQFYHDILLLPVNVTPTSAEVTFGSSRLTMTTGDEFDGVHHLAFGILPSEFEMAHEWLADRVPLLSSDGSEIILGSDGWNSRSLYFLGPEGIILELIARDADASRVSSKGENPHMLSISEVGFGVENVLEAVATLSEELGVPSFYDLSGTFASMGSHDGLLIVVQQDRLWFPNKVSKPARGPLTVQIESSAHIESPAGKSRVDLSSRISIVSA